MQIEDGTPLLAHVRSTDRRLTTTLLLPKATEIMFSAVSCTILTTSAKISQYLPAKLTS
jgi:hypothetical protein